MEKVNIATGIVGAIASVISLPGVWQAMKKSKYKYIKINGYRETLLKYSLLLSAVSPIIVMIIQACLYFLLRKGEPDINEKVSHLMINLLLLLFYIFFVHSHMAMLVYEKVKKRYRIMEGITIIEMIISFIFINFNNNYFEKIWELIYILTVIFYLSLYIFFGYLFGDTKKVALKEIRICLDYTNTCNCYVIAKIKSGNFEYLNIDESYIEIKSKKDKLIKQIPMDKISEITYHY